MVDGSSRQRLMAAVAVLLPGGGHWYAGRKAGAVTLALFEGAVLVGLVLAPDAASVAFSVVFLAGAVLYDLIAGQLLLGSQPDGEGSAPGRQVLLSLLVVTALAAGATVAQSRLAPRPQPEDEGTSGQAPPDGSKKAADRGTLGAAR
jgi:hypothetical protein